MFVVSYKFEGYEDTLYIGGRYGDYINCNTSFLPRVISRYNMLSQCIVLERRYAHTTTVTKRTLITKTWLVNYLRELHSYSKFDLLIITLLEKFAKDF